VNADDRIERSSLLYERALFEEDAAALTEAGRELDAVKADLALARGRLLHGRLFEQRNDNPAQAAEGPRELPLFEQAAQLYQGIGDDRGEAEAMFWIGCCHQVIRRDDDAAVPVLERSLALASQAGDKEDDGRGAAPPGHRGAPGGRPDLHRRWTGPSPRRPQARSGGDRTRPDGRRRRHHPSGGGSGHRYQRASVVISSPQW
jgi:hypothetical protein